MLFNASSKSGHQAIDTFFRFISSRKSDWLWAFYERVKSCPVEVVILNPEESPLAGNYKYAQVIQALQQAWQKWNIQPVGDWRAQVAQHSILDFCEPQLLDSCTHLIDEETAIRTCTLWRIRQPDQSGAFILILDSIKRSGLPLNLLNQLTCLYQVEQGKLPLHSSGIIYREGLFLFTGPSGAGKSTTARLSQENGTELLDEDQILVRTESNGRFYGDGWGYQVKEGHAPIRAIFSLVQAAEDRLVPLPQVQAARLLVERFFDVATLRLSSELLTRVFSQIATLARSVPAYELHFRKTPDFWKLIDVEFPD